MLVKNLPKNKLFQVLFIRLILDGLAGIQFLFKGKLRHLFAVLESHFSFYSMLVTNYKKRDTNQKKNYFNQKSIVYQYFINNGKVFENLK
jgi:hypothetical protein